jgi:predicted transcriptional regulator
MADSTTSNTGTGKKPTHPAYVVREGKEKGHWLEVGGATTPETHVLTAHVPAAFAAKVDALAGHLDRSRGWVVKQALADVDAERGVAHEQVKAWAASLSTAKPLPVPKCKQAGPVTPLVIWVACTRF